MDEGAGYETASRARSARVSRRVPRLARSSAGVRWSTGACALALIVVCVCGCTGKGGGSAGAPDAGFDAALADASPSGDASVDATRSDDGSPPSPDGGDVGDGGAVGDAGTPTWWRPTDAAPIHWHWQLSEDFVVSRDLLPHKTVFDIDGELTSADTVAQLHALGPDVRVICYMDAGVYEDYRSDAAMFPSSVLGNPDVGWPGSRWLDIRQTSVLLPIMHHRMMDWCKAKGFDAVEPDETEVWDNDSGFPITQADNDAYNQAIAAMAHSLGLSVGLKGNNTEAPTLEPYFDWALTEQCWQYDECTFFRDSFLAAGKAVFEVEYNIDPNCAMSNSWHMNSSRRDLDLTGPTASGYLYQPCVPDTQDTW